MILGTEKCPLSILNGLIQKKNVSFGLGTNETVHYIRVSVLEGCLLEAFWGTFLEKNLYCNFTLLTPSVNVLPHLAN